MARFIFIIVYLFCFSASAFELRGSFVQGGLIIGQAEPGSSVYFNNKPIATSSDGLFVFGFERDEKSKATIKVITPANKTETKSFTIAPREFNIQRITGLPPKMVNPSAKDMARIKQENKQVALAKRTVLSETFFNKPFTQPAVGKLSGFYGSQRILNGEKKNPHLGIDVAAPKGADVIAPLEGIVTLVGKDMYYNGNTVIINHGLGVSSVLIHLDQTLVQEGDRVTQGQIIGKVGMTGRATGPHLHWGVSWLDTYVDPELLLNYKFYIDTSEKPSDILPPNREDGYISNPKPLPRNHPLTP